MPKTEAGEKKDDVVHPGSYSDARPAADLDEAAQQALTALTMVEDEARHWQERFHAMGTAQPVIAIAADHVIRDCIALIATMQGEIHSLAVGRDYWRKECATLTERVKALEAVLEHIGKYGWAEDAAQARAALTGSDQ